MPTPDEGPGRLAPEVSPTPEVAERFVAARRAVFATGEPVTFELRRPTVRGRRCVEYRVIPERGAGGAVETTLAIGRDVTEARSAADALRESERRLATLLANLPGTAYRMHDDERWTPEFVSEGTLALTGYAPADLLPNGRLSFEDVTHPGDRARARGGPRGARRGRGVRAHVPDARAALARRAQADSTISGAGG